MANFYPSDMHRKSLTLDEIVQLLKSAQAELQSAEDGSPSDLGQISNIPNSEESQALEELLHEATHEIGSSLGFYINDIETLIAKLQIRSRFAQYSNEQFKQIAQQGWSLRLIRELHEAIPSMSLDDHSSAIHSIRSQLSALPKLTHSRCGGAARRQT